MVTIRRAKAGDGDWVASQYPYNKPDGYFQGLVEKQAKDELVFLIAEVDAQYAGHCKIIWQPYYPYYKENGIPELQDLNVVARLRRQGIASKLMDEAETIVATRSDTMGIGFGLYADYGAAQRMYILRGYVPDGRGLSYQDEYPEPGSTVRLDDDLVLHLTKKLR